MVVSSAARELLELLELDALDADDAQSLSNTCCLLILCLLAPPPLAAANVAVNGIFQLFSLLLRSSIVAWVQSGSSLVACILWCFFFFSLIRICSSLSVFLSHCVKMLVINGKTEEKLCSCRYQVI